MNRSTGFVNGTNAVVYVRVSTDEQVENHSLKTQEEACRRYCEQAGLSVARLFREEGASAKTINRPEMNRMIEYIEESAVADGIGYLVVYRVDRFSRNAVSGSALRAELATLGVQLRSATERIDESPEGILSERLFTAIAEFDNNVKSERTRNGMIAGALEGNYQFRPPLGYLPGDRKVGLPSLVVDPVAAPIIQEVFDSLAHTPMSKKEAHDLAVARGLTNAKGDPIAAQTFHRLVSNPAYAGWNVSEKMGIRCRGDWEPLVSEDVWEQAQKARNKPSDKPLGSQRNLNNPVFPLRRIVRCGECGVPCTGSNPTSRSGKRYGYYHCRTKGCSGMSVRVEVLEHEFVDFLKSQSLVEDVLAMFGAVMRDVWKKRTATARTTQSGLEDRIRVLDGRILKVSEELILGSSVDREACETLLNRYREDMRQAESQIKQVEIVAPDINACVEFASKMLTDLPKIWNHLQPEKRSGFVRVLYSSGLTYSAGVFGTAETPWHIRVPDGSDLKEGDKVPPTGFEPV